MFKKYACQVKTLLSSFISKSATVSYTKFDLIYIYIKTTNLWVQKIFLKKSQNKQK